MIARFFHAQVRGRCDVQCSAVQKALDDLAGTQGRARLLAWLWSATSADLCDRVMVEWARAPLKLATGRTRDEWLSLIG